MRTYLTATYQDRSVVASHGARYDSVKKSWYVPDGVSLVNFSPWIVQSDHTLPGEQRLYENTLFVDLIPSSTWFQNARNHLSSEDWQRLRSIVLTRANWMCEVCHATHNPDIPLWRLHGYTPRLDVHERWSYNDGTTTQKLERLILLCQECHMTTHFGFVKSVLHQSKQALKHLCKVTNATKKQAESHVHQAFLLWNKRSEISWNLDLSIIEDAGFEVRRSL